MISRVYCRCNSGHYFTGVHCPLDGWSSIESRELAQAVEKATAEHRSLSVAELRRHAISDATLSRAIVIEFGSDAAAFDAVVPEGYVVNEQWRPITTLGREFK